MLAETPFPYQAAPIFLVLGVAWARNQRGWLVLGFLWLLVYSLMRGAVDGAIGQWLFAGPFSAAMLGVFLFYGGYRFAARRDESERADATAESGPNAAVD